MARGWGDRRWETLPTGGSHLSVTGERGEGEVERAAVLLGRKDKWVVGGKRKRGRGVGRVGRMGKERVWVSLFFSFFKPLFKLFSNTNF
jgi:hypothetical protein